MEATYAQSVNSFDGEAMVAVSDLRKYEPSQGEFDAARDLTLEALGADSLPKYYDVGGNYAGSTFTVLGTNDPNVFTSDDLLAVTTLSVRVEPVGIRHLLGEGRERDSVLTALKAVPADVTLAEADDSLFEPMWDLHLAVKSVISPSYVKNPNSWVTASKLTARKRPALIPVRDNVVGKALGKRALKSTRSYWCMMRSLLRDDDVAQALIVARQRIGQSLGSPVEDTDLRVLDAALWMHSR